MNNNIRIQFQFSIIKFINHNQFKHVVYFILLCKERQESKLPVAVQSAFLCSPS